MPPLATDADAPPGGVRVHASLPQRERRGRLATLVSIFLHALVIYFAIRLTAIVTLPEHSPIGDAIQMVLGGGGGGGKSGSAFARPTAPPPPPVVTPVVPPPPTPTVVPPPPPAQPVPPPAAADANPASTVAAAGTGGGTGGGSGTGDGPGSGSGRGPGSGGGSGGGTGGGNRGSQPVPHQMIVPGLDSPKKMHGKSVDVTFYVAADGHVLSITVAPPIDDRSYARKFDEVMRDYRFTPAKDSTGKAIAGVTVVTVTF